MNKNDLTLSPLTFFINFATSASHSLWWPIAKKRKTKEKGRKERRRKKRRTKEKKEYVRKKEKEKERKDDRR